MSEQPPQDGLYSQSVFSTRKLVRESNFEAAVETVLAGSMGYLVGSPGDYDKSLCMMPQTVARFLQVTQPAQWTAYREVVGADAEQKILRRIQEVVERKGTLHVMRKGVDESGHHFDLCFFKPAHGMNPETRKLYEGNVFHVVRQLKYSLQNENSLDMAVFLNGLPILTAELKNKLTGQTVWHAQKQYREDRDPKEPLFRFLRCIVHFAVDTDLVYMTTELAGKKTRFFPFNRGYDGGAGNPPRFEGISTAYLWEDVWSRDSILDLLQRFVQVIDELDPKGRVTGKKRQVFPRYHQLDMVRRLAADVIAHGTGKSYLNQHSAGSGKTIGICTLASNLAVLHNAKNERVFSTVIILSDARVIDRMLQRTMIQFVQTPGMVENIDKTARQLKAALEDGKRIIVSTIQKFPVIMEQMEAMGDCRFAVLCDEAHSSQTGQVASAVNRVLSYGSGQEEKEEEEEDDEEDKVVREILKRRGRMKHVSFYAFTATPKPETLELFAEPNPATGKAPFSLYTMRQAIDEGFIVDVLTNYTTYNQYFHLLRTVKLDPMVDKRKATKLLRKKLANNREAIKRKARIMVDHYMEHVMQGYGGRAKAMVVTRNRLHAVRYALEIRAYLEEVGAPFQALVAFTETVKDPQGGLEYTEAGMNGFPSAQTEDMFNTEAYGMLVVANKFQTGFDQPFLKAMYVDRKLSGVQAVQTLSRLNRKPGGPGGDEGVFVLDFENETESIKKEFQKFYDRLELTSETNPNTLYDIRTDLDEAGVYSREEVEAFCKVYYSPRIPDEKKIQKLHGLTDPLVLRFKELDEDTRADFKSKMRDYVKLYGFLSQIVSFKDPGLERLFGFSSFLVKKLPGRADELPTEILSQVEMDNFKPALIGTETLELKRGAAQVDPKTWGGGSGAETEDLQALSAIIEDLNKRFGTKFSEEDRVVIRHLEERIEQDPVLAQQLKAGSKDAVRMSFEHVAQDFLHDMIESNFRFYRKVQDDQEVSKELFDHLFDRYYERKGVGDKPVKIE